MSINTIHEKMSRRDPKGEFEFVAEINFREGSSQSFDEKRRSIVNRFQAERDLPRGEYEIRTADLLEELKDESVITDWVPTDKDGVLEMLKIDFLILRKDSKIVGLQATSTDDHAWRRRKKIGEMYGDRGVIAFVWWKHKKEKRYLSREEVKEKLIKELGKESLMTVDYDK